MTCANYVSICSLDMSLSKQHHDYVEILFRLLLEMHATFIASICKL